MTAVNASVPICSPAKAGFCVTPDENICLLAFTAELIGWLIPMGNGTPCSFISLAITEFTSYVFLYPFSYICIVLSNFPCFLNIIGIPFFSNSNISLDNSLPLLAILGNLPKSFLLV